MLTFEGWSFISNKDAKDRGICMDEAFLQADKSKPIVVFGSFQDLLGTNENGGVKAKNEFIHTTNWDLVIFDEYHFGAWKENAKNYLKILMKRRTLTSTKKNIRKMRLIMPITKLFYPSHQIFIYSSQELPSEPLTQVNS